MPNPRNRPGSNKGRRIPNLVMEIDNEKGPEFRVQCEVGFTDTSDAIRVLEEIGKGTEEGLKSAKQLVLENVDPDATPAFKKIVASAFDDNVARFAPATPRR